MILGMRRKNTLIRFLRNNQIIEVKLIMFIRKNTRSEFNFKSNAYTNSATRPLYYYTTY